MVIDVGSLLRGEVDEIDINYKLTPDALYGVEFNSDAEVAGKLTNRAGYMRLNLRAELDWSGECARCLEPVSGTFAVDFQRTAVCEGVLTEQELQEESEEYVIIRGAKLDIDELLQEELALSFPTKLLCSEDCPGLCPRCGKPRREGDCGCPTREIDPRLAILATLLDKNKENDE